MDRYRWGLLATAATILAAIAVAIANPAGSLTPSSPSSTAADPDLIPAGERQPAPEFIGLTGWLNSSPLTMAELRGRVVLIDFWTYSCINCVDTFPFLRALAARYSGVGLTIVGIHSPEFDFEKSTQNLTTAITRLDVTWPVAVDTNMATWNAWSNHYWPAEYVVDTQGRVAYEHFGQGDYTGTEWAITSVIDRPAPVTTPSSVAPTFNLTQELYAGSSRGQLDGGERYGPPLVPTAYSDPGLPRSVGTLEIVGGWTDHLEFLESTTAGHVRVRFRANDVFIVAALVAGLSSAVVLVTIDGEPVGSNQLGADVGPQGQLTVDRSDLYHILTMVGDRPHVVDLTVPARFRLYTFQFE